MNYRLIVFQVFGAVLFAVGDVLMRYWQVAHSKYLFWSTLVCFALGGYGLVRSYEYGDIAILTTICILMNVGLYLLYSWLIFGDKLTGMQLAGVGLAIVSVWMMES